MADVPLIKLDGAASDGQVPTADGAGGYDWETPAGGSTHAALMYQTAAMTFATVGSNVTVAFDTESLDESGAANTSTGEYTAPEAGLYTVSARTEPSNPAVSERFLIGIQVDGATKFLGTDFTVRTANDEVSLLVSGLVSVAANAVITTVVSQIGGTARSMIVGDVRTYMHVAKV